MKKTICSLILFFIGFGVIPYSFSQVIDFSNSRTAQLFKLKVGAVRFSKESIYNSLSGKDAPNKYHAKLVFGKQAFDLRIFNSENKWVLRFSQGFLSKDFKKNGEDDAFSKYYDAKTKMEYYKYTKNGYYVTFQKVTSLSNEWVEIHIVVCISAREDDSEEKYLVFNGTGEFLYNTVTHQVKQRLITG